MKTFLPSYIASNMANRAKIRNALVEGASEGATYEQFVTRPAYKQLFRYAEEKAAKARESIYEVINKLEKGEITGDDAEKRVFLLACVQKAQDDLIMSIQETIELGKDCSKELDDITSYDKNEIPIE